MRTVTSAGRGRTVGLAVLVAASLGSLEAKAGAWTQPEGNLFARLATKSYAAQGYFDPDGARTPGDWWSVGATYDEINTNLIIEYGLLERLTLVLDSTAKFMHSAYPGSARGDVRVNGLSDVIVGARYGLMQSALVAAVEAKAEIPTGYRLYTDRVRLGNGWANGQFRALLGGGLPLGISNYFDSGVGFRLRGGGYANDLMASLSVGVETFKRLWFRLGAAGVFNLGDSHSGAGSGQPADASYLSGGGALTYVFDWGLGLEVAASADLWGKNTFAGRGVEFVVQYQHGFKKK